MVQEAEEEQKRRNKNNGVQGIDVERPGREEEFSYA